MSGLNKFRPQRVNANKHTERGIAALDNSIRKDGWIGALTVAADGETFDGSARLEALADAMPSADPIIVESDGTRPVIVRRMDIPNTDDPRAKRLGIAANVIAHMDYAPDGEILAMIAADDDAVMRLVRQDNLSMAVIAPDFDPMAEWQGMPEFEQEDKTGFRSILVHFDDQESVDSFSKLIDQTFTDKTKSIWYPFKPHENLKDFEYRNES